MNDVGVITCFSIIHNSMGAFQKKAPYVVAVVALNDGVKHTVFINNYKEGQLVEIGQKVHVTSDTRNELKRGCFM